MFAFTSIWNTELQIGKKNNQNKELKTREHYCQYDYKPFSIFDISILASEQCNITITNR